MQIDPNGLLRRNDPCLRLSVGLNSPPEGGQRAVDSSIRVDKKSAGGRTLYTADERRTVDKHFEEQCPSSRTLLGLRNQKNDIESSSMRHSLSSRVGSRTGSISFDDSPRDRGAGHKSNQSNHSVAQPPTSGQIMDSPPKVLDGSGIPGRRKALFGTCKAESPPAAPAAQISRWRASSRWRVSSREVKSILRPAEHVVL